MYTFIKHLIDKNANSPSPKTEKLVLYGYFPNRKRNRLLSTDIRDARLVAEPGQAHWTN